MPVQRYIFKVVRTRLSNYGLYIKPKDSPVLAKILSYSVADRLFICDTPYTTRDFEYTHEVIHTWEANLASEDIAEPINDSRHVYRWYSPWTAEQLESYIQWLDKGGCEDPFLDSLLKATTESWRSRYRMMNTWLYRLGGRYPGWGSEFPRGVDAARIRLEHWNSTYREVILAPEDPW